MLASTMPNQVNLVHPSLAASSAAVGAFTNGSIRQSAIVHLHYLSEFCPYQPPLVGTIATLFAAMLQA